jgi:hypothetical protein
MKRTRIKRPHLERNTPVRTWSTLFGPPAGNGADPARASAALPGMDGAMDAVQRGVEFAYRVSEEYLRQGQAFAGVISQPAASAAPSQPGPTGDISRLTERMLRFGSELSSMWVETLRMMTTAGAGGSSDPAQRLSTPSWMMPPDRPPAGPPARPSSDPRGRVAVKVESKLRTRAAVDLEDDTVGPLSVGPLRQSGGRARMSQVHVEPDGSGGPVTITIRVPTRQAAGTYVGDIVDRRTRAAVGTVTVRVSR